MRGTLVDGKSLLQQEMWRLIGFEPTGGGLSPAILGICRDSQPLVLSSREGRIFRRIRPWRNDLHRRTGLDPEPIVDGTPQLLFTSQVAFRGLNRNVPKKELNLIEFAAGQMT